MAKYHVTKLRNPRQTVNRDLYRNGTLYLCQGAVPSALGLPSAGNILSQHAIGASAGAVASGQITYGTGEIADDASANNSGDISHLIFADSTSEAVAIHAVPSQATITINGSASLTITQGVLVAIDSLEIAEGNA